MDRQGDPKIGALINKDVGTFGARRRHFFWTVQKLMIWCQPGKSVLRVSAPYMVCDPSMFEEKECFLFKQNLNTQILFFEYEVHGVLFQVQVLVALNPKPGFREDSTPTL